MLKVKDLIKKLELCNPEAVVACFDNKGHYRTEVEFHAWDSSVELVGAFDDESNNIDGF